METKFNIWDTVWFTNHYFPWLQTLQKWKVNEIIIREKEITYEMYMEEDWCFSEDIDEKYIYPSPIERKKEIKQKISKLQEELQQLTK